MATKNTNSTWNEAAIAGLASYSEQIRYEYSPPTSYWENSQRAEFTKIVAECYNTADRNVRTWFSWNQRQTAFLRKDLPRDILSSRIILAECLLNGPLNFASERVSIQRVKGVFYNLGSPSLRELLIEGDPSNETFQWQYNGYLWNPNEGDSQDEINEFNLIWLYGIYAVPAWLPSALSPVPKFDPNPFGTVPTGE